MAELIFGALLIGGLAVFILAPLLGVLFGPEPDERRKP
jgi:hypothetical protein